MAPVHRQIFKIRTNHNSLRYSVKRRSVFQEVGLELGHHFALLRLDCEARWSSTFKMVKRCYIIKRVIRATASRIVRLSFCVAIKSEWMTA